MGGDERRPGGGVLDAADGYEDDPALGAASLLMAWEDGATQVPVRRALALLGAAWPGASTDRWAALPIGRRDERLLVLQDVLFGPQVEAVAGCPACAEQVELSFRTDDVRVPSPAPGEVMVGAGRYQVHSRLPTSADLLELAEADAPSSTGLLQRCVQKAQRDGATVDPAALPDEVVAAVAAGLASADPQADVNVELTCPACGHAWSAVFDIASYLWNEVDDWARRLISEIHVLASTYGWSEDDILAMSARRRRMYVEMVGP